MRNVAIRMRTRLIALGVGVGLLTILALHSIVPTALALPAFSVDTYYFSDPQKTNQVGERHLFCSGGMVTSGKVTRYYVRYQDPCW